MTEFEKLARVLAALDLLGEVPGGRSYEDLLQHSRDLVKRGHLPLCYAGAVDSDETCGGRPKDLEIIAGLQALLEERQKMERGGSGA